MRVHCRTNLDLHNEEWPTDLPVCPRVGELIQSKTKHGVFQLRLEVVRVTWKYNNHYDYWIPEIELHDHWPEPRSIVQFFEWYAPLVGKSVGTFV